MILKDRNIAFIGGGHITEIILGNLIGTGTVPPGNMTVSDPVRERLDHLRDRFGIQPSPSNADAVGFGDFVFINVLPQVVSQVIEELKDCPFSGRKVIVTLAAGIPMGAYTVWKDAIPVVRALPNPPSQIGKGVIALAFNGNVTENQRQDVLALFSSMGETVILKEELINAVTALSTPATVYFFFQALIDAGVRAGIDRETSARIVSQTIMGSMEVYRHRRTPPHELMSEASTPGGISVECLFTLDRYAFRAALNEAVQNGAQKAARLGGHNLREDAACMSDTPKVPQ
jgi:pyrroline-5-carboxylate reductase